MIVLGVDPSFSDAGLSIVDMQETKVEFIQGYQVKTLPKIPDLERIEYIIQTIDEVTKDYPDYSVGLEIPFPGGQMSAKLYTLFISLLAHFKSKKKFISAFANTQAHALVQETKGKRTKVELKTAMIEAFRNETGFDKKLKSDAAEAYFLAKHGGMFLQLFDGHIKPEGLGYRQDEIFMSDKWNSKKTGRKGMLYRPWESYYDYRTTAPVADGNVKCLR